jgi:hypothetical protein
VELVDLRERLLHAAQRADDGFELGALAPEALRALGVGPNGRILELAGDLLEPLALSVIVKGTSAARQSAP